MKEFLKRYKKLITILSLIVFIGVPMIIQFIIENNVKSKGDDSWLSFFGSYFGGIIGGIISGCITLYVLWNTLNENRKEKVRNEKQQLCHEVVKLISETLAEYGGGFRISKKTTERKKDINRIYDESVKEYRGLGLEMPYELRASYRDGMRAEERKREEINLTILNNNYFALDIMLENIAEANKLMEVLKDLICEDVFINNEDSEDDILQKQEKYNRHMEALKYETSIFIKQYLSE